MLIVICFKCTLVNSAVLVELVKAQIKLLVYAFLFLIMELLMYHYKENLAIISALNDSMIIFFIFNH